MACTDNGRKRNVKRIRGERERQGLLVLDAFHKLHVFGMNDVFWDRVRGLGSETLKRSSHSQALRNQWFATNVLAFHAVKRIFLTRNFR